MHLIRMSEYIDNTTRSTLIDLDSIRKVQAGRIGKRAVLHVWSGSIGAPSLFVPITADGDDYSTESPDEALRNFQAAVATYQR